MYYDANQVRSYDCLLNFIVTNRGWGKTTAFTRLAINDFIKKGEQFIYLRRYKEEFSELPKFFDNIIVNEFFPDATFKVNGKQLIVNDKHAGQAIALSTSAKLKSTPFPLVTKIIFDEFIIDKGVYHYLRDEVKVFLEFLETVIRDRDNVRVYFLSNAITTVNPYFLYFDLKMPTGKTIYRKSPEILLQIDKGEEFIKHKQKTRFGKLITGTSYGDYAIDNEFLRDNDTFIQKRSGNAFFRFAFIYMGTKLGVWLSLTEGRYWVSETFDPSSKMVYSLSLEDHSPNTLLLKQMRTASLFKPFLDAYKLGLVFFESQKAKALTYDAIRNIIT